MFFGFRYCGTDYTDPACLKSLYTNLYLWIAVLALLALAEKYGERGNAFSRFMVKSSYGLYILHYPVLIVTCWLLTVRTDLPAAANYFLAAVIVFAGTAVLYEGIRRVPGLRFLILGIRKNIKGGRS